MVLFPKDGRPSDEFLAGQADVLRTIDLIPLEVEVLIEEEKKKFEAEKEKQRVKPTRVW
jgi:hypothetical protein